MIRDEVGKILGVRIPDNQWDQVFEEMARDGSLDQRAVLKIIVVLCKHLEAIDDTNAV